MLSSRESSTARFAASVNNSVLGRRHLIVNVMRPNLNGYGVVETRNEQRGNDATTRGFGDRYAMSARLGRDGQRRVRVGVLDGSRRCANPRKFVTTSIGMGNARSL